MEQKRPAKAQKHAAFDDVTTEISNGSSAANLDLFQLLGADILCHILSYRLCLSEEGPPKAPSVPFDYYREAKREEVTAANPGMSFCDVSFLMRAQFEKLSDTERKEWDILAESDQQRYEKETDAFVTPEILSGIMNGLSLVSKQWYNGVGEVMNAGAPHEIISSRDLFQLKCRALSLDLQSVCEHFIQRLQEVCTQEHFYDGDFILHCIHSDYSSFHSFANIVATEYIKFLIVKCVETITINKNYSSDEVNETIKAWREKCAPLGLILDMFWRSHMNDMDKYKADCQTLIGKWIDHPSETATIGYTGAYFGLFANSDYGSKTRVLFHFERQLPPSNFFFGRFGGDLIQKHWLLSHDFVAHPVVRVIYIDDDSE